MCVSVYLFINLLPNIFINWVLFALDFLPIAIFAAKTCTFQFFITLTSSFPCSPPSNRETGDWILVLDSSEKHKRF